jgi:predicted anti-sigma-YlaC factor YlaD
VDPIKTVEHLTQKQIEDYSQNRLGATELLALSEHLGACEVCRQRMDSNGDAMFFALHADLFGDNGVSAHLTSEQTAEYVDKNLAGEELQMAVDHLSNCEQCAIAVNNLRAFRNEIAPSLDREYAPVVDVPAVLGTSWRRRFLAAFRTSPVPAFGGAVLAVLVLAFIGWMIWRTTREAQDRGQDVIVSAPTPSVQPAPSGAPSLQPESVPAVAQLNDGAGVLSLDREGKLSGAENLPPKYQGLVKKALSGQKLERSSQLQGLTRPPSSLMGSNDEAKEFSVVEPAGNVLMTDRPAFRWSRLEDAKSYVVEVYDDQFKLAASSPELTALTWTTTQPLPRGRVYSWQVKANKDGAELISPRPPAPQAKFRILDQARVNEISRARRTYASSHLTLALLYADAGLLKEAEQELRLLRRANPNSDIPRNLLRQVHELGRR